MSDNIGLSKLVEAFANIKAARTAAKREWEKRDIELEEQLIKVRSAIHNVLNATGASSIVTDYGTAFRRQAIKPSVSDWGALYDWATQDPGRLEIMEKRVKASFVKDFMDENDGALPPGVNVHREFEVVVRKPNTPTSSGDDYDE